MNVLTPNTLGDFMLTNPAGQRKLEMILSRRLPFPFNGKTGILLHGVWGTGKSTLATVLTGLIETAYEGNWNFSQGVINMPAANTQAVHYKMFRCGAALTSTAFSQAIQNANDLTPLMNISRHDYFVFDEVDRLTAAAQQSLRSLMDLKRCMYFFTTNNLSKIDQGVLDRCHLVEMNQASDLNLYVPFARRLEAKMSLPAATLSVAQITDFAKQARGSMRELTDLLVFECLNLGGTMP